MLTHSPSAEELRKFLPMIGCHTMTVKKENFNPVKDDAEGDACNKDDCISCEYGGNVESMNGSSESFRC